MRDQAQAVHHQRMRMCKPAPAGSKAGAPVERLVVADGLCPGPYELVYGQSSVTGKHIHLHRLDPFDIRSSTSRRVAHRVWSGGAEPGRRLVGRACFGQPWQQHQPCSEHSKSRRSSLDPVASDRPPSRSAERSAEHVATTHRRPWSSRIPILLRTPELAPNASGRRYYPGDLTHLCRWSWSEPQLTVQCTHAPSGHHRQARVGSETGSFIGIRPGLEPQNADTLRDRFAGHSQCLCRRAEDVDHVYRQINVAQRPVGPRTEDLATSRVHRDDLVPLRLQITRDHVRRLGAVGGGSNHCDRLGPLVDPNKFLVGKMSHAVHRLASFDVEHYGKNVSGADVLPLWFACPEPDPATGRPEAAVSGDHMLRWPLPIRDTQRPPSRQQGKRPGGHILASTLG